VSNFWADPIRQLRQDLGLSPIHTNPFLEDKFSPYLVVALFSSIFGQPQPDWAKNTVVAGFTFYDGT
jgi:rhamnosyltransferase subunit B